MSHGSSWSMDHGQRAWSFVPDSQWMLAFVECVCGVQSIETSDRGMLMGVDRVVHMLCC